MKNFFIGLITGIILCVVAGILVVPGMKQTAHDEGYAAGTKKGEETGTAAGIAKGEAKILAEQKAKHDADAAAAKSREEAQRRLAAARKKVKVVKPQQNWHVIDGKIADPIKDEPVEEKKPAEKKDN